MPGSVSSCDSSLISIGSPSDDEIIGVDPIPTSSRDNRMDSLESTLRKSLENTSSSSVIDSDDERGMQSRFDFLQSDRNNNNNNNNEDEEEENKCRRNRYNYRRNNIARDRKIRTTRRQHIMQGKNKKGFRGQSIQLSSMRAIKCPTLFTTGQSLRPYGQRLVRKSGNNNVSLKNVGKLELFWRYSKDMFTTLVDLSWTGVFTLTVAVYISIWLMFGLAYWGFAIVNNDYDKIYPLVSVNENITIEIENEQPCVSQVYDFVSAFLFSMESSTTIGYGSRAISTACPLAITCLSIQCVISAILDTWVIGMCYIRMARPDARRKTTLFAKDAVICTRDGQKCLIIRIANLRKSLLLSVSIRARMITLRDPNYGEEEEGHQLMLEQHEIKFKNSSNTMLTAPIEYCHVIDKSSPLKDIPIKYFNTQSNWFEIVVIVTGTVEATGLTMHAQASYLSSEIKYRHRFVPIVSTKGDRYLVDFKRFHEVVLEPTPCACTNPSCENRWHVKSHSYADLLNDKLLSDEVEKNKVFVRNADDNVALNNNNLQVSSQT